MVLVGKDIEKQCSGIYPLQSVYVRKVKIVRAPRFDVSKLMEVHGDYTEEVCTQARDVPFSSGLHGGSAVSMWHASAHVATCICCALV